jgi:hypothetical protein
MAAIDSKNKLQLLEIFKKSDVSRKTGLPYTITQGQFVVHTPTGIRVGTLSMRGDLAETPPGDYLAEFELGIDFDNKIVPLISKLHPFGTKPPAPAPASAAKA